MSEIAKYDYALEVALIGALFAEPSLIAKHGHELTAEDFPGGRSGVGGVYEFIVNAHMAGKQVTDLNLMLSEMHRAKLNPEFACSAFLGRAFECAFAWNTRYYIDRIKKNAEIARLTAIACEFSNRLASDIADPKEVREWLESRLSMNGHSGMAQVRSLGDVAKEIVERLKQPKERQEGRAIFTGLFTHDNEIGGWMPGELIVLAARPGMGKTAMATQIAKHNAVRNRRLLFVSIEMTEYELGSRILAGQACVDGRAVRSGSLTVEELQKLESTADSFDIDTFQIWAPSSRHAKIGNIRGMCKLMQATGGLDLLIVDYIGIITPDEKRQERTEQIAGITAGLKGMAKELGVPVLALCQLNRQADGAEPRLSNLRESGAIEQDADVVMFLHRDRPENPHCDLIVAKHRHSTTGKLELTWRPEITTFEEKTTAQAWDF